MGLTGLAGISGLSDLKAQSVKELEEQRKATLKQLETSTRILGETQKNKKTSLNKLNILSKNIHQREKLINNINTEIQVLDKEMTRLNTEKVTLETKLERLKKDYAKMVQEAYKNRSLYNKLMFLLSADNFDQTWRRFRYIQEFSNFRKKQGEEIQHTHRIIVEKTEKITENKFTKIEVVNQKRQETQKLASDKKKESTVLNSLQKKEKKLQADIRVQKKKANELNNRIESIIAEEIRKAEEKQRAKESKSGRESKDASESKETRDVKTQKKTTTSQPVYTMTKEEKLISGNFENNRGKLPWPVEKGFISGKFGIQSHPVLKYVTTNNKGIYIQTPSRANARVVFDGIVTQRFSVPGSNWCVIVKHGQYRTVYANLSDIYVSVGQKVSTKESIGRIYTDPEEENKTELYFQVWKDRAILNPEGWISR